MKKAAAPFQSIVDQYTFQDAVIPVILNRTGQAESNAKTLAENLPQQIHSQVKWVDTLHFLGAQVDTIIECGPGRVLTGLLKKTEPEKTGISINNAESLRNYI